MPTDNLTLPIQRLHPDAVIPTRANPGDAGYDLTSVSEVRIFAGGRAMVSTGLAVAIPPGHYGRIAPRSGLAAKNGIMILGGVIDAGYRGEVKVLVLNTDLSKPFDVAPGVRIAQLILERISTPEVVEVEALDASERGAAGFGSSGGMAA